MARIAGVDLPREKRIEIGLTYIYGIGRPSADKILRNDAAFFSYRCSFVSDPVYDLRSLRRMALSGSCLLCCMADQCRPEYRSRYTGSYPKHSF